jgi:hypothetical protein
MRGAFAACQATRDALSEAQLRSLRIWSADRTPENLALHVQAKKALSLAVERDQQAARESALARAAFVKAQLARKGGVP